MENTLIKQIEISRDQFLRSVSIQKNTAIPQNIISEVQFLINRIDELKTVLKEIDEILNRIKEESLKNLSQGSEF